MVEITDIKCGHLFQRTQQHGGCTVVIRNGKKQKLSVSYDYGYTRPLSNDKFV